MNGQCIVIDSFFGEYSCSIVDLDNSKVLHSNVRMERHMAYYNANKWHYRYRLNVRVRNGQELSMPDKKYIEHYKLEDFDQ